MSSVMSGSQGDRSCIRMFDWPSLLKVVINAVISGPLTCWGQGFTNVSWHSSWLAASSSCINPRSADGLCAKRLDGRSSWASSRVDADLF
jgi:hypothetical protein